MRLSKSLPVFLTASMFGLFACGGGDDSTGDDDDGGGETQHYKYVADSVLVPTTLGESSMYALDIAGTTAADNALGNLLATLVTLGLDVKTSVDENVANGTVIVLADLGTTSFEASSSATMEFFLGQNPNPAACTDPADIATCGNHLDGSASFDVSTSTPDNAVLDGAVVSSRFAGGPGNVTIELSLAAGTDPISIDLIGAKVEVNVAEANLTSGKLGGAITDSDIRTQILPAVTAIVAGLVDRDCSGAAGDCCPGAEGETAGGQVQGILDENDDCSVTQAELEAHPAIAGTLLNPDLDMLNGDTFEPDVDGTKDSLSLAVGFTMVPASF